MAPGLLRTACALRSVNTGTLLISPWTTHASMLPLKLHISLKTVAKLFLFTQCLGFHVSVSSCAFITFEKMESADQAVAEVGSMAHQKSFICLNGLLVLIFFFHVSSQLNGTTVGDVHIKVSIARKQPMLDAATGKSVWASLGKLGIHRFYFVVQSFISHTPCDKLSSVLLSQLCRTAQKAPTGTRGTKLCTVKISCDFDSFFSFIFMFLFYFICNTQPLKVLRDSRMC